MKFTPYLFVVALLSLFIYSCNTKPTETAALETKISGRVLDKESNAIIAGAQITTSPTTSSVTTDASGNYTIEDVKAGQYVVGASKTGFKTNSINVVVTEGKTVSADVLLETIKPEITLSISSIDYGTSQTTASIIISNGNGVGSINWTAATSVSWLTLSHTTGFVSTTSNTVTLTANRSGLSYGNYSTVVTITSNGGNKDIAVTMTVANPNAPQLTVSPLSLDFGSILSQHTLTIRNSGTGKIDWAATSAQQWISISPKSDSTRSEIDQVTVTVNRNSMLAVDYSGDITITSNAGSQTVNVKMNVPAVPSLNLPSSTLDFDSVTTQRSFLINNGGSGSLNWSASGNQPWISVSPFSGTNSGTINVTASRSGLTPGNYSGTVSILSNGGNGSVSVMMKVALPPAPQPVTVTEGDVTTSSINLSWTQSTATDFSAYKVFYSTSAAVSENSTLATTIVNKTTTSFTVTGLSPNITYYFRVFVLSSSQQTSGSNTATAKTDRTFPAWQQVALPVNFQVQSMHYIAENNIWIAGYTTISNYNFPRIYHYDGTSWLLSNVQAQDSISTFRAIAFRNNTEGWAATNTGKIYKFNGASWTVNSYLSSDYNIDEGIGTPTDVWFYGSKFAGNGSEYHPLIYRWNGNAFTELIPNTLYSNWTGLDMHFINANTGFAVSDVGGIAYRFNGVGWIDLGTLSSGSHGLSISGTSQNDIWAADYNYLYHYDGTNWKRQNDIGGNGIAYYFSQIRMVSASEGWAVCRQSPYNVYYYNGTSWSKVGSVSGSISEIKDFGSGNLWGIITGTPNKLMRLQ